MGLGGSIISRRSCMGQLPKIRTVRNRALAFKILVMEICCVCTGGGDTENTGNGLVVLSRGMRTV